MIIKTKIYIELDVEAMVMPDGLKDCMEHCLSDMLKIDFCNDELIGEDFKIKVRIEDEETISNTCIDHTPIECHCDDCLEKNGWDKKIRD